MRLSSDVLEKHADHTNAFIGDAGASIFYKYLSGKERQKSLVLSTALTILPDLDTLFFKMDTLKITCFKVHDTAH
ncbi:MAG: hypothetical protein KAS70_03295 [Planctomycetes bacterium]|nr:hypothetical protein [Planctomycetota bacterium]MCK5578554.1 hypothetical protein [Planctomycetota bacterium]